MDEAKKYLLEALSCAVRGTTLSDADVLTHFQGELFRLAIEHHVLSLVASALHNSEVGERTKLFFQEQARQLVIAQAQRTADFLLLLRALKEQGLCPVVVKGFVCRSLYPEPELRPSVDEDLLIRPEEYEKYCAALEAEGFLKDKSDASAERDYDVSFTHPQSLLCIELHTSLFPMDSEAFDGCAQLFEGALDRAINLQGEGDLIRTLSPTDHLLFLIFHAYKHLLYGGVGIRQLCDIALMAEKDDEQIDWPYIRQSCEELNIAVLTAAMFRICEKHLGFAMPSAFADLEVDESALLEDILSGGLYGVTDINRAHSSTMTLEAVSADRSGRRRKGVMHSVFLPPKAMQGHFSYLRKYPWLLPAAWVQRIYRYLARKSRPDPVSPARSLQIARERVDLLREYRVIR